MVTTSPSTGSSSCPHSTAIAKTIKQRKPSASSLYHAFKLLAIVYLRIQCGISPDQFPSGWHCLVLFPLSMYPIRQLYIATDERFVDAESTMPPMGCSNMPQSIAATSNIYMNSLHLIIILALLTRSVSSLIMMYNIKNWVCMTMRLTLTLWHFIRPASIS